MHQWHLEQSHGISHMHALVISVLGALLIAIVLRDAFETVILPQTPARVFRLARLFYRSTWRAWSRLALLSSEKTRKGFLNVYGPLSIIALFAFWAWALVLGF